MNSEVLGVRPSILAYDILKRTYRNPRGDVRIVGCSMNLSAQKAHACPAWNP